MTKTLRACVSFARWSKLHGVDPADLAHLMTYANTAFKAAERECNTGQSADKQREQFEGKARALGFDVEWNGLGPTLTKDGRDIYLPEV